MKFIVIEIQKSANGSIAIPPIATYDSFFAALSAYHSILASAAISELPLHSAVLLNEAGQELRLDSFDHTNPNVE